MDVKMEYVGTLPVVVLSGRLDMAAAPLFDAEMAPLLAQPHPRILLDLGGVTYISSAGLRSVLALVKHTSKHGGRLALVDIAPQIREIIEISGFPSLMDIYPDRASALVVSQA
jgi:stage II sporulation protein AA (anti-sigma F factor antagonist)